MNIPLSETCQLGVQRSECLEHRAGTFGVGEKGTDRHEADDLNVVQPGKLANKLQCFPGVLAEFRDFPCCIVTKRLSNAQLSKAQRMSRFCNARLRDK